MIYPLGVMNSCHQIFFAKLTMMYIVVILLGTSVGATTSAESFLNVSTLKIVALGLTIDERIADGYYYSKTVRLLKKLLENPELLEAPFGEEVEY